MARTVLPVQQISRDGLDIAFVRPDYTNDHSFDNTGHNNFLLVRSALGITGATITIVTPNSPDGLGIADKVLSMPDGITAAIADDGGVFTDETTEANDVATNDMTLLPVAPAVEDAYYFGSDVLFHQLYIEMSTVGSGSWTIVWEYWDGDSWEALAGVEDETSGFTAGGGQSRVAWSIPADFDTTTVNGVGPLWWVRARVSVYTSITTQPLGEQAFSPRTLCVGPFPAAVYDTIDTDPEPDIDPAVFVDLNTNVGLEIAVIKLPGASY